MLAPVRTSAPTDTPLSLTEAKTHLRIDHSDDDALITALIEAATDHLDGYSGVLGRALVTQTWRQDFDGFCDMMRLPLWPVASISSVTYYDADNVSQTLSASVYDKFADARGAYLALKPDQDWPSVYDRIDAVQVTYVAGSAVSDVPAALKATIKLIVGHLYENREAVVTGVTATTLPMAVDSLTAPFRRVGV